MLLKVHGIVSVVLRQAIIHLSVSLKIAEEFWTFKFYSFLIFNLRNIPFFFQDLDTQIGH